MQLVLLSAIPPQGAAVLDVPVCSGRPWGLASCRAADRPVCGSCISHRATRRLYDPASGPPRHLPAPVLPYCPVTGSSIKISFVHFEATTQRAGETEQLAVLSPAGELLQLHFIVKFLWSVYFSISSMLAGEEWKRCRRLLVSTSAPAHI